MHVITSLNILVCCYFCYYLTLLLQKTFQSKNMIRITKTKMRFLWGCGEKVFHAWDSKLYAVIKSVNVQTKFLLWFPFIFIFFFSFRKEAPSWLSWYPVVNPYLFDVWCFVFIWNPAQTKLVLGLQFFYFMIITNSSLFVYVFACKYHTKTYFN